MPSRNYLIGADLWDVELFDSLIFPKLREKGYHIHDRVPLSDDLCCLGSVGPYMYVDVKNTILISITGDMSRMSKDIEEVLIEVGKKFEGENIPDNFQQKRMSKESLYADLHPDGEKGLYRVVGSYEDDDKASSMIPSIINMFKRI